jgi:hypothetical protein
MGKGDLVDRRRESIGSGARRIYLTLYLYLSNNNKMGVMSLSHNH